MNTGSASAFHPCPRILCLGLEEGVVYIRVLDSVWKLWLHGYLVTGASNYYTQQPSVFYYTVVSSRRSLSMKNQRISIIFYLKIFQRINE